MPRLRARARRHGPLQDARLRSERVARRRTSQALAVTRVAVLPNLDPTTYERHALHAADRAWVEKNCYVDIWIEVIHALGLEPTAIIPFVLGLDFEGDQWT